MMAPTIDLRGYQSEAVAAAVAQHRAGRNPVLSLPTGSGKALVAAAIARTLVDAGAARIVITVPSRELAEQNEDALHAFFDADEVGVVCASLGRRETGRRIIVGTPQSLVAGRFHPDCVIVDEAHQMPLHRGSWFARLFDRLPKDRATPRIGLSGTTFRTADGAIFGSKSSWFDVEAYAISVAELISQGFLAPIHYVSPAHRMTTRGVTRGANGDYNATELVEINLDKVEPQVDLIMREMVTRKRGIIFAINVNHALAYRDALRAVGEDPALIIGAMRADDRRCEVAAFKSGAKRIAITVAAGLTGLDVPHLDLIASCRPTMSAIVHSQSLGRGTRPAPGKTECLNLDFAGNVRSFGPIHDPHFDKSGQPLGGVAPYRPCRVCGVYAHFSEITCDECGALLAPGKAVTAADLEFGTIQWTIETRALGALVADRGTRQLPVEAIAVHAYRKRSDPTSVSLMVSFALGEDAIVRRWVTRLKSTYWREFWVSLLGALPAPTTIAEAINRRHELVRPTSIDIKLEGAFWRVTSVNYCDDGDDVEPPFAGPQPVGGTAVQSSASA